MAIVVPDAQTPFQPVSQPRRSFAEPNAADGLADLADVAISFGVDQVEHERAMAMQGARVTAVERLGALRDQYEQDPNVGGLSDRFRAEVEKVGAEISEALPDGRLKEQFDLDFRQMANPQVRAIGKREYGLQRDMAIARLNSGLDTYAQQAAAAPDRESRDAVLNAAAADIGAAEAAGWLKPSEAERLRSGVYGEAVSVSALQAVQRDPQEFLDRAEDGEFDGIDPKQMVRLKAQADRAVLAEEKRLEKQAEMAADAEARQLTADVEDAVEVIEGGLRYDEIAELMERAAGTPHEATLRATLAAAETEGNFTLLDPVDQAAVIAELRRSATQDPEDVARLNRLVAIRERTEASLAKDPLSHVSDRGMMAVDALQMDNPASVKARIAVAEAAAGIRRDGPELRYLTNGERDTLRAEIERGDADGQLAVATQIVSAFGNRAQAVLQEVGEDRPAFHLAGQLVMMTGDIAAARTMLQGQQMIADRTGATIAKPVRQSVRSEVSGVFPPASRARLTALMEAADAHFASAGLSLDPEATDEQIRDAYMRSVQAVSGGVQRGGRMLGGVQEVNGSATLLPPVLTGDEASDVLAAATPDLWAEASITGSEPHIGGRPLSDSKNRSRGAKRMLGSLQLMSIGGGQYLVGVRRSNGEARWLTDPKSSDGLFRFDLEGLARAVREVQP